MSANSELCSACGKRTSMAAVKCAHCGGATRHVAARAAASVSCPHCALAAQRVMLGPLELDVCERCGTTWFDHGEVEAARDAGSSANFRRAVREFRVRSDAIQLRPYVTCPVCVAPLRRKLHPEFAGVIAYACSEHGAWVERRHLLRLIDEVEKHGAAGAQRRAQRRAEVEEDKRERDMRARAADALPQQPHALDDLDWFWFW